MYRIWFLVAVLLALGACRSPFGAERAILLPVRDLVVPEHVAANAELEVTLTVVTGGCRSFDRIEANRSADRLTLIPWGRDASGPGVMCTGDIRYEEKTYRTGPVSSDPFTVVVRQPGGTELVRQVRVR